MKRKYYKIHHYNYARPMKRVKRRRVNWRSVLLVVLALALVGLGVAAVVKWTRLGSAGRGGAEPTERAVIPLESQPPQETETVID